MPTRQHLTLEEARDYLLERLVAESRMPTPDAPRLDGLGHSESDIRRRLDLLSPADAVGQLLSYTAQFGDVSLAVAERLNPAGGDLASARAEAVLTLAQEGCWDKVTEKDAKAMCYIVQCMDWEDMGPEERQRHSLLNTLGKSMTAAIDQGLCAGTDRAGNLVQAYQVSQDNVAPFLADTAVNWETLATTDDGVHTVYAQPETRQVMSVREPGAFFLGKLLMPSDGSPPKTTERSDIYAAGLLPEVRRSFASSDAQFEQAIADHLDRHVEDDVALKLEASPLLAGWTQANTAEPRQGAITPAARASHPSL